MTVKINDVPIDYELENEQTAGDVHDEIVEWLRGSGHVIEALTVDGTDVSRDGIEGHNGEWRRRPVDSVGEIHVRAVSRRQEEVDALETIMNYVDLYRRVLVEGSVDQLVGVAQEFERIDLALSRLLPEVHGLLVRANPENAEERAIASERAREVHRLVAERQRELLDPQHEMRQVLTALEAMLPHIVELPAQLQTGREREALTLVARLSGLVSRFVRLLPLVGDTHTDLEQVSVGQQTLGEAMAELTEQLKELQLALEAQDLVLVADLMEYEMQPRLESLCAAVRGRLDEGLHGDNA